MCQSSNYDGVVELHGVIVRAAVVVEKHQSGLRMREERAHYAVLGLRNPFRRYQQFGRGRAVGADLKPLRTAHELEEPLVIGARARLCAVICNPDSQVGTTR